MSLNLYDFCYMQCYVSMVTQGANIIRMSLFQNLRNISNIIQYFNYDYNYSKKIGAPSVG